eukprot:2934137-Alexandrium_andersonii.AAC.1
MLACAWVLTTGASERESKPASKRPTVSIMWLLQLRAPLGGVRMHGKGMAMHARPALVPKSPCPHRGRAQQLQQHSKCVFWVFACVGVTTAPTLCQCRLA